MLHWNLEWGAKENFLERQASKGIVSAQKTWASRAVVEEYFEDVWNAFNELHRARQVGFGVNAITYSDICAWLNINCVYEDDDRKFYCDVIINVDSEYITWARDREEKKRQKSKPKTKIR